MCVSFWASTRVLPNSGILHSEALTDAHAADNSSNLLYMPQRERCFGYREIDQATTLLLFTDLDLLFLHTIRSYPSF